jgi:hypothetical protein
MGTSGTEDLIRLLALSPCAEYITQAATEMHSSFSKHEVSTESRDIVGSLWTI